MMKRYFLILVMALTAIGMNAEKLEDRYVSKIVSDGMLFFIKPFELPNQDKGKPAEADITYLIQEDTMTLNMSVYHSSILQTDSISFEGLKHCTVTNFETFYIDKKGKQYVHRYSCALPYTFWRSLYMSKTPFRMSIYSEGTKLSYGYSDKKWLSESTWMLQILQLIERNKKASKSLLPVK